MASCSTSKSGTSKSLDIVGSGVIHKPVIADLDVQQQKISSTTTLSRVESMDKARNEAIRQALLKYDADILVEPSFTSVTEGGKTELTVNGWPAKYKNFRQISEDDIKYLELKPSYLQKAALNETVVEEKKSGSGFWVGLAALLIGGSVAAATL